MTELYDSHTETWERVGDLPGPAFQLNEYQSGVFQSGNIFCIGFVTQGDQTVKAILGYNVEEGIWSTKWNAEAWPTRTNLQLVEIDGNLYLFSERDRGPVTEHWVDIIKWIQSEGEDEEKTDTFTLVNVVRKHKSGGRGLEVYPEDALVPISVSQLCLYDTIDHVGEAFVIKDQEKSEALPASAPSSKRFQPSNPVRSFALLVVLLYLLSAVGATPVSAPWPSEASPSEVSSTYSPVFYLGVGATVFGTILGAIALGVKVYRYCTRRESEDTLCGAIEKLTRPFEGYAGGLRVRADKLQVGDSKLEVLVLRAFPPGTSPETSPGSSPGTSTRPFFPRTSTGTSLPGTSTRASLV